MSKAQWILNVQLQQYQNEYNAVRKDRMFCCCDETRENMCESDLQSFLTPQTNSDSKSTTICAEECDVWFKISLFPCSPLKGQNCTKSNVVGIIRNSPRRSEFGLLFQFESSLQPEYVS